MKRVRKPSQPRATMECKQPRAFPFLRLVLPYLLLPHHKSTAEGQTSPLEKGFCSSKESKQQFSKHTEVGFCQRRDFSILRIKYALSARFKSSGAEEAPVQVEQVFPNTQYLLDHSRSRNIKTSSSCGHVQSRPTCSSHRGAEPFAIPVRCWHRRNRNNMVLNPIFN